MVGVARLLLVKLVSFSYNNSTSFTLSGPLSIGLSVWHCTQHTRLGRILKARES
jgi:hypothetical protein